MRLVVSWLRRLVRRPATWITVGLLAGLMVLVFLAVGATANRAPTATARAASVLLVTFPGAYSFVLSFILGLGGLFGVLYGAAIAGSEWSWGTLKMAVARGESRSRYVLSEFVAVALLIGCGILVTFAIGVGAAAIGATLSQVSTAGMGDSAALGQVPEQLARAWLGIAEEAAIGTAIATIARSQLAGIGAGIGIYFGEQFARIFLPDIVKYLPFDAANALFAAGTTSSIGGSTTTALGPEAALVAVLAWLAGALLVMAVFTERAEVTG